MAWEGDEDEMKEWKLIETVEITEEGINTVSVDLDRNYNEAMLIIYGKNTFSSASSFINANDTNLYYGPIANYAYRVIRIITDNVRAYTQSFCTNNMLTPQALLESYGATSMEKFSDGIEKIKIAMLNVENVFDIGLKIEVYAR